VRGKVGIAPLPAMPGGTPASCAGGWQWAVSAFSTQKPQAVALLRWLASTEVAKVIALQASMLPAVRSLYDDAELQRALPWLADALPALEAARARPATPRYGEVSDVLRTTTAAVLGRSRAPDQAVLDIQSRLRRVLR
jgi:multiple sugar transport system substrate-binding protein